MARRTKAQWQALIGAHGASGQKAAAFCREQGINARYFSLRRRQLSEERATSSSSFAAVSLSASSGSEAIRLEWAGVVTLRLPLAIEPGWLATLLRELRY